MNITFSLEQVKEIWKEACRLQREICASQIVNEPDEDKNIVAMACKELALTAPEPPLPNTPVLSAEEVDFQIKLKDEIIDILRHNLRQAEAKAKKENNGASNNNSISGIGDAPFIYSNPIQLIMFGALEADGWKKSGGIYFKSGYSVFKRDKWIIQTEPKHSGEAPRTVAELKWDATMEELYSLLNSDAVRSSSGNSNQESRFGMAALILFDRLLDLRPQEREMREKIQSAKNEKQKEFFSKGLANIQGWIKELSEAYELLNSEQVRSSVGNSLEREYTFSKGDQTNPLQIMRDLMSIIPREWFEEKKGKDMFMSDWKTISNTDFKIKLSIEQNPEVCDATGAK